MLDDKLDTIFYYLRTKRFAIYKMTKFVPPLDEFQLEEMQIMYGIYFNALISLIEYIKNELKQEVIINTCYKLLGSENNYKYVRELRNSIIHRGLNVSDTGTVLEDFNIVVPFAPAIVKNQSGNKTYNRFTDDLFHLVEICEQINHSIFQICLDLNMLEYTPITKDLWDEIINKERGIPKFIVVLLRQINFDYNKINEILKLKHEYRLKKYFNTNDLFAA